MVKVVVIGSTVADFLLVLPKVLQHRLVGQGKISFNLGEKIELDDYQIMLGGCGANVAVGLKRLGIKAELITALGEDTLGTELKTRLHNQVTVHSQPADRTALSIILDAPTDRAILVGHSKTTLPTQLEIPESDWLYLGPLPTASEPLLATIQRHQVISKVKIAINPSLEMIENRSREFLAFLRSSEAIFLNKTEAITLTRLPAQSNLEELAKAITYLGPKIICLTDGAKGAWVQSGTLKRSARGPVDSSDVMDSTGAGDAFASGFLAGYLLGEQKALRDVELLEQAFGYALLNAAGAVSQVGAQSGLRTQAEIEHELGNVKLEVR